MTNVPYKVNARDTNQLAPLKPGNGGLVFGLDDCWHSVDTLGNVQRLAFANEVVSIENLDTPGGVPSLNVDGDQFGLIQLRVIHVSQAAYSVPMDGETVIVVDEGHPLSVAFGGDGSAIFKRNAIDASLHAMLNQANLTIVNLTSTNRNNVELPGYYKLHAIGGTVNFTGLTIPGHGYPFEFYLLVRSGTVTVKHQSTESIAGNRFICNTGADIVLATNDLARVIRDPFQNRWRIAKW